MVVEGSNIKLVSEIRAAGSVTSCAVVQAACSKWVLDSNSNEAGSLVTVIMSSGVAAVTASKSALSL